MYNIFFNIEFSRSADKTLEKLQDKDRLKIIDKLELLAQGYENLDIKAMSGPGNMYRLRVGDYRIVYTQHFDILIIEVIKIGHRKEIYK